MAEGARLESVCTRKGTEGSNPSLSATSRVENTRLFLYLLVVIRTAYLYDDFFPTYAFGVQ